jgi:hypothetical protein
MWEANVGAPSHVAKPSANTQMTAPLDGRRTQTRVN